MSYFDVLKWRLKGVNPIRELKKLFILSFEELRISIKNKKLWTFIVLMLLPSLVLVIAGALFLIPENQTEFEFWRTINPNLFVLEERIENFREGIKNFYFLTFLYWLNLPIVIATAIYTSEFIAGERSKGSFDLFATKPVLRTFLTLAKFIAFAIISYIVTVIVYFLMFGIFSVAYFTDFQTALYALWRSLDILNIYISITWLFTIAVSSITILFSSLTKRPLFATFGTLAYMMGYGIGVSLISAFIPGTLGTILSEQLSYIDLLTVIRTIFMYWLTGSVSKVFTLTEMDPSLATAILSALIIIPITAAFLIIETKDLL